VVDKETVPLADPVGVLLADEDEVGVEDAVEVADEEDPLAVEDWEPELEAEEVAVGEEQAAAVVDVALAGRSARGGS
jgi:hypothetical protein